MRLQTGNRVCRGVAANGRGGFRHSQELVNEVDEPIRVLFWLVVATLYPLGMNATPTVKQPAYGNPQPTVSSAASSAV
jgi:hypothetical protein